jgi:hypothetical protein
MIALFPKEFASDPQYTPHLCGQTMVDGIPSLSCSGTHPGSRELNYNHPRQEARPYETPGFFRCWLISFSDSLLRRKRGQDDS